MEGELETQFEIPAIQLHCMLSDRERFTRLYA
jgi:hypothetical protein